MTPTPLHQQFHRDGYLVLPGFKSAHEIAAVRQRALDIVEAFDPAQGSAVFTTNE